VELVGALPLVAVLALSAGQVLAAGAAHELAAHAAEAGAVALLQGTDPQREARASLPGWSRQHAQVLVAGSRVRVRVRPPGLLPGLAGFLTATSQADAGPLP
jgi:hypothetical protein